MRQSDDPRAGRNAESTAIPMGAIGVTSPFSDLVSAGNTRTDVNLSNRASNTNNVANVNQNTGGGTNVIPIPVPVNRPQAPRQTYPIVLPWTYPYAYPYPQAARATTAAPQTGSLDTNALLAALLAQQQQQQQPIVSLSSGLSTSTLLSSAAALLVLGVGAYVIIKKVKSGK